MFDIHFNEQIELAAKTYNDYPKSARQNARRALEWAKKNGWGSCGTAVGKMRANQLANGQAISRETISRMASFARHRQNKDVPYSEGCGGLMWDAWGGTSGIEWAQRKLDEIDANRYKMSEEVEPVELAKEKPSTKILNKFQEEYFEMKVLEKFSQAGVETPNDLEILFEEEVSDFSEELLLERENELLDSIYLSEKINGLYVYYRYAVRKNEGPNFISGTRDFCKTMLKRDRLYTKDEIIKLGNNDLGTDIWKYRGGYWNKLSRGEGYSDSCRHVWKRILTRKKVEGRR